MTEGRESREANAVFYLCSLIEFIARRTKNRRGYVVDRLGEERLKKILELADIYHSDNIERVADDFIGEAGIETGEYDNVAKCRYAVGYRKGVQAVGSWRGARRVVGCCRRAEEGLCVFPEREDRRL